MQQLTQHRAFTLSEFGIRLHKFTPSQDNDAPKAYTHQDDYYIIGVVEKGVGHCVIDFKEIVVTQGDLFLIQPKQVHRFISSKDAVGWVLFVDSILSVVKRNGFLTSSGCLLHRLRQMNEK